ncbi:MAG: DUF5675 family protein [Bacteroidota bacterium]
MKSPFSRFFGPKEELGPKDDPILAHLPLMNEEPDELLDHQAEMEALKAYKAEREGNKGKTKTRGFLLRPNLVNNATKPKPVAPQPKWMVIDVVRYSFGKHDTLGKLYIDGKFVAYTLEDEKREVKKKHDTCIPPGKYKLSFRTVGGFHDRYKNDKRFKDFHIGMLWVRDVPNFQFILIHVGNTDKDTSGCLLVGLEPDRRRESSLEEKRMIVGSGAAYKKVYPIIANHLASGQPALIRYTEDINHVEGVESLPAVGIDSMPVA